VGPPEPAPTGVRLYSHERMALEEWVRRPPGNMPALALRARIVLACAEGRRTKEVAQQLEVHPGTVAKWRRRYQERGIEGLRDEPRPGAERSITDEQIEAVIDATLERPPPRGNRWTIRSMGEAMGMSSTSVQRIWQTHGIDPGRLDIVGLATDPAFLERVQAVGLYLRPPEGLLALAVEPPGTAEPPSGPLTSEPGEAVTGLLATAAGLVVLEEAVNKQSESSRDLDNQQFVKNLDQWVASEFDVYVVVDHSATETDRVVPWLARNLRFHLHVLPTQRWWIRVAARLLSSLADHDLGVADLEASIDGWFDTYPDDGKPLVWYDGCRRNLRRGSDER
jgi:transposase